MKQLKSTRIIKPHIQQELFLASPDPPANQSISVYRVSLVKDESVSFGNVRLANSQQAQALIQNLILTKGQPDSEQFVVAPAQRQERADRTQHRVSLAAYPRPPSILVKCSSPPSWPILQQ
jgi:hypothetical protein